MIYLWAFGLSAVAFMGLAIALLMRGWRNRQTRLFALAAILHGLWAGSQILPAEPLLAHIASMLHIVHFAGWALFLISLLRDRRTGLGRIVLIVAPLLVILKLVITIGASRNPSLATQGLYILDLLSIITALATVVGVFQAASEYERWALKFLCIPLGGVFAYDLFLYAHILAIPFPETEYFQLRGVLNFAITPFLFIAASRHKFWRESFYVSRQAALYSITLIGIGIYLLVVAFAAFLIPKLSTSTALPLQVSLLFFAVLLLLFLLSSGSVRAKLKLFMARHFYARKYDYAHEWRRLMQTLSADSRPGTLEHRIIRACAEILEVPGGALWLLDHNRPQLHATWNYRANRQAVEALDFKQFFDVKENLQCLYKDRLNKSGLAMDKMAWMAVPLVQGKSLAGFIVLSPPRVHHDVDHEDEELILMVARQCSSFLIESRAVAALEQNKQFARFNRQYAFVAHDIKNIISQLSVMLRNFDRHADNPAFQKDMHETISNSVSRLQRLIERLSRLEDGGGSADEPEDIAAYEMISEELGRFNINGKAQHPQLQASEEARRARIRVPKERFTATFGHLLTNALDASRENGNVFIHMDAIGQHLVIDIIDEGEGMSLEFIRDELFVPFKSTKSDGFGVGAFQCREFAREQGGDLEVVSSPGSGTTMRLLLPML